MVGQRPARRRTPLGGFPGRLPGRNTLGYLIGRSGGRQLLHRLRIDKRHLDKVEDGFDRYGGWLIVFARIFDGTRQLNGIAAAILAMPWARFTL